MITDLDKEGLVLLELLIKVLRRADPFKPETFITYTEVHKRLGVPILFGNPGRSLQVQGLNSLATWTAKRGVPAITGLVVRELERDPGPGYFRVNGKRESEDLQWWQEEMSRAKEVDWQQLLKDDVSANNAKPQTLASTLLSLLTETDTKNLGKASGEKERALLEDAQRIANLIFARVAISGATIERTAPERTAQANLVSNVYDLLHVDPLTCYLCGGLMQIRPQNRLLQPSPDRVDSSRDDYGLANLRLAHLACNLGKNAASVVEYQQWLQVLRREIG